MGNSYGDAWLEWLYDLDTEVRITSPSEEVARVHGIQPKRYLVLPGSNRIFPGDMLAVREIADKSYYFEPCRMAWPQGTRPAKAINDCEPGELYRVSLVHRFFQVTSELEAHSMPVTDSANEVTFNLEPLEMRLANSKNEFIKRLSRLNIPIEPSHIYARMAAIDLRFPT